MELQHQHFRGIKVKGDTGLVAFERPLESAEETQMDTVGVEVPDEPHPDLTDALDGLTEQYVDILDLTEGHKHNITITGVELKGDNPIEVVVHGERDLPGIDGSISVSTPSAPFVRGTLKPVFMEVVDEAMKYLNGKRMQLNLFEDPETPEERQLPETSVIDDVPEPTPAQS